MQNIKSYLVIAFIGLLAGAYLAYGHTYFPREYQQLAFSHSVWLAGAFIAGLFAQNKKQSFLHGAAFTLLASISAYVLLIVFLSGGTTALWMLKVLLIGGIILGPLLAYLALQWKQHGRFAILAPIIVTSLFLSEGVAYFINRVSDGSEYLFVILAAIVFAVLYRKTFNFRYLLMIIPLSGLFFLIYIVVMVVALTFASMNSGYY